MSGWRWDESPADVAIRHLLAVMRVGASVHYHGLEVLRLDTVRWSIEEGGARPLTDTMRALAAHRHANPLNELETAVGAS